MEEVYFFCLVMKLIHSPPVFILLKKEMTRVWAVNSIVNSVLSFSYTVLIWKMKWITPFTEDFLS